MQSTNNDKEIMTYRSALVLECWSSDPHDKGDCDLAIIELSEALISTATQRMALYRTLEAQHEGICAIDFADFAPDFFALGDELEEIYDSDAFQRGSRVVTKALSVPATLCQSVDTCWMEFDRYGCIWRAIPANADLHITTIELTVPELVNCWNQLKAA